MELNQIGMNNVKTQIIKPLFYSFFLSFFSLFSFFCNNNNEVHKNQIIYLGNNTNVNGNDDDDDDDR